MKIEVLLFAAAREAAGSEAIEVEVPSQPQASDVIQAIGIRLPEIASLLPACRLGVDCCFVAADQAVQAESEIALIPPVSGG